MIEIGTLAKLYQDAARWSPGNDATSRRIARACELTTGSRVLDLGCGTGPTARLLAREHGCRVTCVDFDPGALETLVQAAGREGVSDRITPVRADLRNLTRIEGEFDAVIAEGSLRFFEVPFQDAVSGVRRFLKPGAGRLAVSVPARVGRALPAAVADFYQERGEPLHLPRELTQDLERAGFEPLAVECLPETLVDAHYRLLEDALGRLEGANGAPSIAALRREVDLFWREGGRTSVNVALLIARRKELFEKPPLSRGGG